MRICEYTNSSYVNEFVLKLICVCGKEIILENVPHYMEMNQISNLICGCLGQTTVLG